MRAYRALYLRIRNLWRGRLARDLDDEIRFHLAMAVREKMAEGISAEDARAEAARNFGNVLALKERSWDMFTFTKVEAFFQDLLYALRMLRQGPSFTLAAVLTLGLGVGANIAIFSVVKAVLLEQLPFREPDRLLMLGETSSADKRPETISFTTAYDWQRLSHSFESMALYRPAQGAMVERGEPELLNGLRVGYQFFTTLGVRMEIGRGFLPEEDEPGNRFKVVLSHSLWLKKFQGDRSVLGRTILLNERAYTIVGVLAADLPALRVPGASGSMDIFEPLGYALTDPFACRTCQHLHLIARLKSGVPVPTAHAELDTIMAGMVQQYPESYTAKAKVALEPLYEYTVGDVSRALWVLLGAVGFVLLIAWANVANLMLVRAGSRVKEIALRAALGASRWRLIRQLLTESLMLAVLGGAAGVLFARWSLAALISLAPGAIPRIADTRIDATVLFLALAASVLTGLVFGLAPALQASRAALNDGIKTTRGSRSGLSDVLVTFEIVLAFVLVVGAALLGKSFVHLTSVNAGFDPNGVLTFKTFVYGARYKTDEAALNYYNRVLQNLRAVPGVESAAMASVLPLNSFDRAGFHIRDRPLPNASHAPGADRYSVSPDYFAVMKIPLKSGRLFDSSDRADSPPVAVISEACARGQFPVGSAIGKQIQLGGRDEKQPWITIVGVVGDVRQAGLDVAPKMAAYVVQAQSLSFPFTVVARTKRDPEQVEHEALAAVLAADPTLPVYEVQPMNSFLASSLAQRSFTLELLAIFGSLSLALAAVGIYGVISHGVMRRTREIGIRMALGADRRGTLAAVLRQGAALVGVGLAVGFAASLALTRLLSSLLFEVQPMDQAAMLATGALLAIVALAASYFPARRAAQVDPMIALRSE